VQHQPRRRAPKPRHSPAALERLHPHAAGIDCGAAEHFVAVPPDRDATPVQSFPTFTGDLHRLADWLTACRITHVAMEATGVYWIPIFEILDARGFQVILVNARHVKNLPGRKSDVSDCQWIQYLHSVGLLKASFRPPDQICVVRSLWRHRESLVQMAAEHTMHMQKALTQMNLQLHHVLSDITGLSGMRILDAILSGERDPVKLAALCHGRVRSPRETVAKSLEGDYRAEHLFALRQSLVGFHFYQQLIRAVDQELEGAMRQLPRAEGAPEQMPPRTKKCFYQKAGNEPAFDLKAELFRISGVDLTDVPGISAITAHTILIEVGPDLSRFRNASAFASWLGLCPDKKVSGGKVLYTGSRKVKNRAAIALRLGAQCLYHAKNYLGEYYRKMKWRLGAPQALTATAHKLARIVFHMLLTKEPYNESVLVKWDRQANMRAELRLRTQAAAEPRTRP